MYEHNEFHKAIFKCIYVKYNEDFSDQDDTQTNNLHNRLFST